METAPKLQCTPRSQLLFGAYPRLRSRDRIARDERIDVTAIEESPRMTVRRDTGALPIQPGRSATAQALAFHQPVQPQ